MFREALMGLLIESFLEKNGTHKYENEMLIKIDLQNAFFEQSIGECRSQKILNQFLMS